MMRSRSGGEGCCLDKTCKRGIWPRFVSMWRWYRTPQELRSVKSSEASRQCSFASLGVHPPKRRDNPVGAPGRAHPEPGRPQRSSTSGPANGNAGADEKGGGQSARSLAADPQLGPCTRQHVSGHRRGFQQQGQIDHRKSLRLSYARSRLNRLISTLSAIPEPRFTHEFC